MKPQVLLRTEDRNGVHFIKRWENGTYSIEGHTVDHAAQHNINVPNYFFPIDEPTVIYEFSKAGREWIVK